jgi:hypothetical protein
MAELPHTLRSCEPSQPDVAGQAQFDAGRKAVGGQLVGGSADEDLPAVPQVSDPGATVKDGPGVARLGVDECLSGVHAGPDPHREPSRPELGAQLALQGRGRSKCVERAGERGHEAVTLSLFERPHPAVCPDDVTDDRTEAGNCLRRRVRSRVP